LENSRDDLQECAIKSRFYLRNWR